MNVLLTGGSGLLGTALRAAVPAGVTLTAPSHAALDVTDPEAVQRAVQGVRPAWILHCAGYTNVDGAEDARDEAVKLNIASVQTVGMAAEAVGARVLLPSTDYVFDGAQRTPYTEADVAHPLSFYAETKLVGEQVALSKGNGAVVRVSWLFGEGRPAFAAKMHTRAKARQPATVVTDQVGTPTCTADLADWIWGLVQRDARGVFHATNAGETTWFEVARRAYARAGWAEGVTPTTAAAFGAKAMRPAYSALDCAKLDRFLGITRRPWDVALDEYLARL